MISTCNSACAGSLSISAASQCDIYQRSEVPVRLLIATCDTAFPTGNYDDQTHGAAVAALFAAGKLGATFELAEFAWSDPTTTKKNFSSKARPAKTITTGRQLTAKDFTATDVDSTGLVSLYEDRLFYKNVLQDKACRYRGWITESGKIYLFLDNKSEFMGYDVNFWTGYNEDVEGQSIEFKNHAIEFVGDPLKNITTPYLDIVAAGVQSSLGWLYQPN